jgi:Ca2+/H+ antiporter
MPLVFSAPEFIGLAVATLVPALLFVRGRSTRRHGITLCLAYGAVVVAFYAMAG